MKKCDIAVIGAGPYGLSVAAHLSHAGVDFRIFGDPMGFWRNHMPKGMHLKSEGFASSLFEPTGSFTLKSYCKENGLEYGDVGIPVPLEVFTAYGLEFQRRFVPTLEKQDVVSVRPSADGFRLTLESGTTIDARRVVVAVGQTYFAHIPEELSGLSSDLLTHSSQHNAPGRFQGKEVAVIGAGASAVDLGVLMQESGVHVHIVARTKELKFHNPPDERARGLIDRLRYPVTGIGGGWKLWLCTNLPQVFRLMPAGFRVEKVRTILGPAPCWFTKDRVLGKINLHLGVSIRSAAVERNRIVLDLAGDSGTIEKLEVDHVIAATGFRTSVDQLSFLDRSVLSKIRTTEGAPALSGNFESSVNDLYFVGVTAAHTFGPMLRFAYGAGFAAPRIARHLIRTASSAPSGDRAHIDSPAESKNAETVSR